MNEPSDADLISLYATGASAGDVAARFGLKVNRVLYRLRRLGALRLRGPCRNPRSRGDLAARFWAKVDKSNGPDGCWPWLGSFTNGYGQFAYTPTKPRRAHVVAYELAVGSVPPGLQLDHLCARIPGGIGPHCVNPKHLEPVTARENSLRSNGEAGRNARKAHCKHGHAFTDENTLVIPSRNGGQARYCRECARLKVPGYRLTATIREGVK